MGKRWLFAPLLAAAVAGPAAFIDDGKQNTQSSQTESSDNPISSVQAWLTGGPSAAGDSADLQRSSQNPYSGTQTASLDGSIRDGSLLPADLSADGILFNDEAAMLDRESILYAPGAVDLRQAFRFDASPQWLQQNWPRVSTIQSLDGLNGIRVPFVSGPNQNDVTGALSYYFDRQGTCERITFYGYSGDPTRITQMAIGHFRMTADASLGGGFYTGRYSRSIRNLLALQPESQSTDQRRYQVTLEINNPQGRYQLSPEASRLVQPSTTRNASFRR